MLNLFSFSFFRHHIKGKQSENDADTSEDDDAKRTAFGATTKQC